MEASLKPEALSAQEDGGGPVVTFMAALCNWQTWDKERRVVQTPCAGNEKAQLTLTASFGANEPIQAIAGRDFHGGDLPVSDL